MTRLVARCLRTVLPVLHHVPNTCHSKLLILNILKNDQIKMKSFYMHNIFIFIFISFQLPTVV